MDKFRLSEAGSSIKLLVTTFLVMMTIAYLAALLNIYNKTGLTYNGIAEHYRGNEEELIYPMEFGDLISTSHTHLIGMTMMFMMLCTILMFTAVKETTKRRIVWFVFAAIFLDIAAIWLTRYVAPQFALLVILAGTLMGLCFLLLIVFPLRDMWSVREKGE
jgi:hypothetical protein